MYFIFAIPILCGSFCIWANHVSEIFSSTFLTQEDLPYDGNPGVILTFPLSSKSEFDIVCEWVENANLDSKTKNVLAGVKTRGDELKEVSDQEINVFCKKHKLSYTEISDPNNVNVGNVFCRAQKVRAKS